MAIITEKISGTIIPCAIYNSINKANKPIRMVAAFT
jgi:hypothetical protein